MYGIWGNSKKKVEKIQEFEEEQLKWIYEKLEEAISRDPKKGHARFENMVIAGSNIEKLLDAGFNIKYLINEYDGEETYIIDWCMAMKNISEEVRKLHLKEVCKGKITVILPAMMKVDILEDWKEWKK